MIRLFGKKSAFCFAASIALAGCGTVRQADLDSWQGMPVEALDTHSLFITVPMTKTFTASGIEIRNYSNAAMVDDCAGSAFASSSKSGKTLTATQFASCTSQRVACNNIFYIKNDRVLEYAPTGSCYTNDTVRPQKRYGQLTGKPAL